MPTRRGPKPAKSKVEAEPPIIRKSRKSEGTRVHDLEKRLAEALKREAEALEQQTATAEILRVISTSPTNLEPVLDAVVKSAVRFCGAPDASLFRLEGEALRADAHHGPVSQPPGFLVPVVRGSVAGRSALERRAVGVTDLQGESEEFPEGSALARQTGTRATLSVPLLREGAPIGVILLRRAQAVPFTNAQMALLQTFADQAVIAIENVRLFTDLQEKNRALTQAHAQVTEALEQQTATSEILRLIAGSPTDLESVLGTVAETAMRVCGARDAIIYRCDGDVLRLACTRGLLPVSPSSLALPLNEKTATGRSVVERRTIHVHDLAAVAASEYPEALSRGVAGGSRTVLATPLLQDGEPLGAILIRRGEVQAFTDKQISLLQTFADQAVIAIENVRLFTELQEKNRALTQAHAQVSEALEQQMATGEILRAISSSPTDAQPVFQTIVRSAVALCSARFANVFRLEGEVVHLAAHHNLPLGALEEFQRTFPQPLSQGGTLTAEAMRRGAVVHVHDIDLESAVAAPVRALSRSAGYRSALGVPILRQGSVVGAIGVGRSGAKGAPWPFSDKEVALLQTFADQAVIAIENVRLFTELQASNRELRTALDTQTATAEILRVISRSQTDVQPVFDTIVSSAVRLCDGLFSVVYRFDGELIHMAAHHNLSSEALEVARRTFPTQPDRGLGAGRAIVERAIVHIPDVQHDPEFQHLALARTVGWRSGLFVPMLRQGAPIGVIAVARSVPGSFPNDEIALLQTFADQAVIAIENVRLFTELQEKNRALTQAHGQVTEALEQQTATSEVLKVISRSTFELEPVLETLIENAIRLCGADHGQVYKAEGEALRSATAYGLAAEVADYLEHRPLPIGPSSMAGRAALERRTIHSLDVLAETWFQPPDDRAKILGLRTVLAVPMLRGETVVGVFTIWKTTVEPFTDRQIELVTTFADQAVIAIENVRLFKELEARTRDLTHSVEELRALGEVSQAVSSTLELETVLATIVSHAVRMSGSYEGIVYEFDEAAQTFHSRATHQITPEHLEALRRRPVRLGEGAVGRAGVIREPVQVADLEAEWQLVAPQVRALHAREGMRSLLAVPLVREDRLFGGLVILRRDRGAFPPDVVATLRTLAAQSVLAIQNARLFREIEVKGRELAAASQHKSEFLANMSHELRTPLNAIIGFSEVLSERMFGELNEKQEEYLKDIHASGQHLLSLINDILDLSKIEAGRMELELTDFGLPTAIDNALTLIRERAARHGIALHQEIDPGLRQIQGDERKLKQVLLNLLSNAIKFTPEGGRIDVRAWPGDGVVEVSVSDTGVGIAPEDQEAIFEEFRQVGTAAKKVEGTGLGLALSRKFIELHGGRIWVESQVGVGSTFTFRIPVSRGE